MMSTTTSSAPFSRTETGTLLGQTMGLVALTAAVLAAGAYIGRDTSSGWGILCWCSSSSGSRAGT